MKRCEKLEYIEETLGQLYKTLPKASIEGTKNCAIAIILLEKIKEKVEKERY